MKITFYGAAREVTGSCYLIETNSNRFLIDCGMIQGGRKNTQRNHEPFPFAPSSLDFVLLTHAHIDHSGLLPKLTKAGFQGKIYTTWATTDLLQVMLPDSAHIQEFEAERANQRDTSHVEPLYNLKDAYDCLKQVASVEYDELTHANNEVSFCFREAGHILGSAIIEVWVKHKESSRKLVFSGDLGQPGRVILRDPTPITEADYLFIESTYGDRIHEDIEHTQEHFIKIIEDTLLRKKGNVIMPAFAVGRTQEIIYHLHRVSREKLLSDLKVFIDSPMASEVTRITKQNVSLFDEDAIDLVDWLKRGTDLPFLYFTENVEESKALNQIRSGAVIISASGMCTAGRIKHHLLHNLPRPECTILITGFQAKGTLGRRLVDGAKSVRIFGKVIPVRASIHVVNGLSAHADQEALLNWLNNFSAPPKATFIVHGEESSSFSFAQKVSENFAWENVVVPKLGATFDTTLHESRVTV